MKEHQNELASSYFDFVAEHFPVMCSSDEFHFLPRAQKARQHRHRLENLDSGAIAECLSTLKAFQKESHLLATQETDVERLIDLELLKANIAGVLIELETKEAWRHNPLLYLKTAFIGLDHALNKPADEPQERMERVWARLEAIPLLFQQASQNIDVVPETYHRAALAMVVDSREYLRETSERFSHFTKGMEKARSALDGFSSFLQALSPIPDQRMASSGLEATLRDHFLSQRSPSEVFAIAVEEWHENLEDLKRLQDSIAPEKSWKESYHAYAPSDAETSDTISLYEREIEKLDAFFRTHGFSGVDLPSPLEVCETPTYLRSVRSAASFSAALWADGREKDLFYMTTRLPEQRGKEAAALLKKRLHREYKFLSAHETIPGHHLLDQVRRGLKNPVRRQIESALFYEGWAYYAESLLTESGYVESPIECLVDHKRRLWRAARCQIDVGMATGRLDREDGIGLLTSVGFSPKEAAGQVDRFRLNPGYQLCYTLGRYEIMELRKAYGLRMGLDRFHSQLLQGGEIPFHLIEKRFENLDRTETRGNEE